MGRPTVAADVGESASACDSAVAPAATVAARVCSAPKIAETTACIPADGPARAATVRGKRGASQSMCRRRNLSEGAKHVPQKQRAAHAQHEHAKLAHSDINGWRVSAGSYHIQNRGLVKSPPMSDACHLSSPHPTHAEKDHRSKVHSASYNQRCAQSARGGH